jgi:superfamily II DNA or RNA helicase
MSANAYDDFLKAKTLRAPRSGFEPETISSTLFPFQRDIVRWALRRGRAAIFADTGLGKTLCQLEWAYHVCKHVERVLILAPLAVAKQTQREAMKLGLDVALCRRQDDVRAGINITNYEMLHAFDAEAFGGVVIDESSILKSFDGATRNAIIDAFARTPYKLACTATPSPNDHTELGNHSEFLGMMTRAEMLAMFFFHDGGETSKWELKGHAKSEFWRWVASWAAVIRHPKDLGYEDDRYTLPPLTFVHHVVPADADQAKAAGNLFVEPAETLEEQRNARRATTDARAAIAAKLANESKDPWLIWCDLNDEADRCEAMIPDAVQVAGADTDDDKEDRLFGFAEGRYRVLVTKSKIAGFGMNLQICHDVAFCGVTHSFEAFYQAVRRAWRFGQTKPVTVHVITSELEGNVVENLKRKEATAAELAEEISSYTRDAVKEEIAREDSTPIDDSYVRDVASGEGWTLHRGDCIDMIRAQPDNTIDYSIFSPPFASLYTYSSSMRDMGNCKTHSEFYEHFKFLVPEMLRAHKPGRLLSFHCMNLPTSKTRDGFIGISDFRGMLIRIFVEFGWIYHSEVVIWKDPVTAMQRTKALGLLHKQIRKDSCMSRQGIPDYLVTMRKPGENPDRVSHTADEFPVDLWQRYASPVWMDINPSETLQKTSAREHADERHIAPLQLEVIRRAMFIWTNPGDLVMSPFAGIGSEGYVALQEGRRFLGAELKGSYWQQARLNLESVSRGTKKQLGLLEAHEAV